MTPEELNRAIEFLIQHQAQFSGQLDQIGVRLDEVGVRLDQVGARLDQVGARLDQLAAQQQEFAVRQDREHEMLVRGFDILTKNAAEFQSAAAELMTIQSRRLDRQDEFHRDTQKQNGEFQKEALHLLNRILDRLPRNRNSNFN